MKVILDLEYENIETIIRQELNDLLERGELFLDNEDRVAILRVLSIYTPKDWTKYA